MRGVSMKVIIDIPDKDYEKLKDGHIPFSILDVMQNGTPIPDNATNGDAVKTLFSNTFDNFCERTTWEWNRWWNSPYQKGG